jgi:hypothetical protein
MYKFIANVLINKKMYINQCENYWLSNKSIVQIWSKSIESVRTCIDIDASRTDHLTNTYKSEAYVMMHKVHIEIIAKRINNSTNR